MYREMIPSGSVTRPPGRLVMMLCAAVALPGAIGASEPAVLRRTNIAQVWSGHRVGFDLLTAAGRQYVAFYDAERNLTVAARSLDSDAWQLVCLPEKVGWDSHNYITLTTDDQGQIHLSGNMHCIPLVYFRTTTPGDIATFQRVGQMIGRNESRCTYPRFFRGPSSELIFTYRDGSSGNGNQIYNVYDQAARTWSRLLDTPLTDGEGHRNAYFNGPVKGPDGFYHLCWVWREAPDCSTNHDLSYVRSRDLRHWETAAGKAVTLPITLATEGLIVDPAPVKGGMINGANAIGFDSARRLVLSYTKYDAAGKTQLYAARFEGGRWNIVRTTNWDYRWEFSGGGSIEFEVDVEPVAPAGPGKLGMGYSNVKLGSGRLLLDEKTLHPLGPAPQGTVRPTAWSKEIHRLESEFPGMRVRTITQTGPGGMLYVLKWETLGPNRDKPRTPPLPEPSMLRMYELRP